MMNSTSMSSDDSFCASMPVVRRAANIDLLESAKPLCNSTTPLPPPPYPAPLPHLHTTLDHLSYLELLGRGAQGAVYRVHDNRTNECLALKVVNMPHDKSHLSVVMYERDASVFAMQRGIKGAVHVKEIFQDSGRCFILMRLGRASLYDEIRAYGKQMPMKRVAFVMYDLADRLLDMHSKGMIHRDIKPENILIDSSGSSWIADLGMAHFGSKSTTGFCGTYEYMAPEVKYDSYDTQADVWSMGVILFYLLLGRYPFEHEDRKLIPDVAATTALPLLPGEVSPEADDLLHQMLTVDPSRRITMEGVLDHSFFTKVFSACSEDELESAQYPHPSLSQPASINDMDVKPMRGVVDASRYPGKTLAGYDWAAKRWNVEAEDVILLAGQEIEIDESDSDDDSDDMEDEELEGFEMVYIPPPAFDVVPEAKVSCAYGGIAASISRGSSDRVFASQGNLTRLAYLDSSESSHAFLSYITKAVDDSKKLANEELRSPCLSIAPPPGLSLEPLSSLPLAPLPPLPCPPFSSPHLPPPHPVPCPHQESTKVSLLPLPPQELMLPEQSKANLLVAPLSYSASSHSRAPSLYWSRRSLLTAATSIQEANGSTRAPYNEHIKPKHATNSSHRAPKPPTLPKTHHHPSSSRLPMLVSPISYEPSSKGDSKKANYKTHKAVLGGLRRILRRIVRKHPRDSRPSRLS
jgi:serine/threonine protein kinase